LAFEPKNPVRYNLFLCKLDPQLSLFLIEDGRRSILLDLVREIGIFIDFFSSHNY
jgi:hypothetical protein